MRGERDIIYKERGCWSSYQEDRTDTASQKWRNSFLRPEIPALMGFITAARILSLHFSAVFLQPLTGQGKGREWYRSYQPFSEINPFYRNLVLKGATLDSKLWTTSWAQNPLKEMKNKDWKIHDRSSSEWVDLDRKHDTVTRASLKKNDCLPETKSGCI